MVNVESKPRVPNNARKRGGGNTKQSKVSNNVNKIDIVVQNSTDSQHNSTFDNLHHNDELNKKKLLDNQYISITRSGRIRRKNKDCFKVMDNILKSELLIQDQSKISPKLIKSRNLNNNNVTVSDQNKKGSVSQSKVQNKNKTRGVLKNKSKAKPPDKMEPCLRQEVISKMKSILSPDDEFADDNGSQTSRQFVKPRLKPQQELKPPVSKTKDSANPQNKKNNTDQNTDKGKPKQVTLSNGVVLTLSLVECDHCQKTFHNKQSLSRHMITHLKRRPHRCPHCPKKFRFRSVLKAHALRRHPDLKLKQPKVVPEYYMCNICDKAFLMQENLELHLASHVKSETNFQCLFCDKKFSHHLLLLQHEKTHLTTNKYKCYMCDMSYDCRSELSVHIKSHKKIKEYICQYCGKEFVRLSGIKRHVRVSHGGQRVQCPICMKKLKGHLTEHMRVHEQNRPHVCDQCGQRFTQSTQLTVHKRSHSGDRPYMCKICKRPFGHSSALMLHIRRHTGEKPFACAMCPMTFSQLPHMKTHMSKIHGKENAYKCHKCHEFFKLKSHLDNHLKICTVGDRVLSFEEQIEASIQVPELEFESSMSLSKMRFLLALLLTMIATDYKLKVLGFNKRLIDDLLEESLTAMGHEPCKDLAISPLKRLKANLEILLKATVPENQMEKFRSQNKTPEQILALLTEDNS